MKLIHGTDSYRIREVTAAAVAQTRAKHTDALLLPTIDMAAETGADSLESILKYPSFFGEQRIVVLSNVLASPTLAKFIAAYDPASITDISIIATHAGAIKADQKKILATLTKHATSVQEIDPLSGPQLTAWIATWCKALGRAIAPAAASLLVARVGTDSWALANELEKLCAYSPGSIDAVAVQTLVPTKPEVDQWALANAVSAHDKRGLVTALWTKLQEGTPEPLLVGTLAGSIRTLLMIQSLAGAGMPPAAIAKKTGLHPFVVSKNLTSARSYSPEILAKAHAALAKLDQDSKVGAASASDGIYAVVLGL